MIHESLFLKFSEWLQCLCVSDRAADDDVVDVTASQDSWSAVVQFIQMTPNTLDVLLVNMLKDTCILVV